MTKKRPGLSDSLHNGRAEVRVTNADRNGNRAERRQAERNAAKAEKKNKS
ncbi:hypothetical protein [Streptomyces sp. NPDC002067]